MRLETESVAGRGCLGDDRQILHGLLPQKPARAELKDRLGQGGGTLPGITLDSAFSIQHSTIALTTPAAGSSSVANRAGMSASASLCVLSARSAI